jgi:hypothetical protein
MVKLPIEVYHILKRNNQGVKGKVPQCGGVGGCYGSNNTCHKLNFNHVKYDSIYPVEMLIIGEWFTSFIEIAETTNSLNWLPHSLYNVSNYPLGL